jgi:endonuclease/exonuclease/phosphatase family metal-dependent hydrolase
LRIEPINAALLAALLGAGCRSLREAEAPTGPRFRVLTYNVNWGARRPELALDFVRRSGAEVVCLQETTPEWEERLRRELGNEYAFMDFRQSRGRMGGGLAFLSKHSAREVAYIPSDTGWFDAWIVAFETACGPVQVLNVHLRPPVSDGGSFVSGYFSTRGDRVRELERFHGRRNPDLPVIVAGDFNDVEGSRVIEWLEGRGMTNALPEFDAYTPTWEWQTSVVTLRRRMDHILYSPELHCASARVVRGGASDHFPVEAVFTREVRG